MCVWRKIVFKRRDICIRTRSRSGQQIINNNRRKQQELPKCRRCSAPPSARAFFHVNTAARPPSRLVLSRLSLVRRFRDPFVLRLLPLTFGCRAEGCVRKREIISSAPLSSAQLQLRNRPARGKRQAPSEGKNCNHRRVVCMSNVRVQTSSTSDDSLCGSKQ